MGPKVSALIILCVAGVIGYLSFVAFLYLLYTGSPGWIRFNFSETGTLLFDLGLCLLFFLQHSGMIRRSFRNWLSGTIPSHYQGAAYTAASGIVLLACVMLWQNSDIVLLEAEGPFRLSLRVVFFLSMLGIFWGMRALRSADMFGLKPILNHIQEAPIQKSAFVVRGPYRWVRHPLYLFMIVLFWSCPELTTDRLLFNLLWTIWVIVATVLEERDLSADFGDTYRDYQAKVPMLLPRALRPACRV